MPFLSYLWVGSRKTLEVDAIIIVEQARAFAPNMKRAEVAAKASRDL